MSGPDRRASIWTRELTPSCRRHGDIEPIDATEHRRRPVRLLPWLVAALLVLWGWGAWLRSERAAIDALAHTDHLDAVCRGAMLVSVGAGTAVLFAVATCVWAMLVALRAGRWPPADARVWQRTRVIGGGCLRLRCGLVLLLAPASALFHVHTGARLVGWAWNTYADARAGDASGAAVPVKPERTEP